MHVQVHTQSSFYQVSSPKPKAARETEDTRGALELRGPWAKKQLKSILFD